MRHSSNYIGSTRNSVMMYIDMNSYFASCEQQVTPHLRNQPIGVTAGNKHFSVIIAPSIEAKRFGVKTGMRMNEAKMLCPQIIQVPARPVLYRKIHIQVMDVLRSYIQDVDVLPKSIDEAVLKLTPYKYVYKDFEQLALAIKSGIRSSVGDVVKCSIGIAPNTFLAKLATEVQKPDGLVCFTPENVDGYLAKMVLTDLPGIAKRSERRLQMIGINTPLQMKYSSPALLRKAFGGIVGEYWYARLNFTEVDFYTHDYRSMSAARTTAPDNRTPEKLMALFISLCTKIEQRLVKQRVFCRRVSMYLKYTNLTSWETVVQFADPVQDGVELRNALMAKITAFEASRNCAPLINSGVRHMGITICDFVKDHDIQYGLFDNRMKQDALRKVVYDIKDKWGKYTVRKACEVVEKSSMQDAIGFGSVKDLFDESDKNGHHINQFLLEETDE